MFAGFRSTPGMEHHLPQKKTPQAGTCGGRFRGMKMTGPRRFIAAVHGRQERRGRYCLINRLILVHRASSDHETGTKLYRDPCPSNTTDQHPAMNTCRALSAKPDYAPPAQQAPTRPTLRRLIQPPRFLRILSRFRFQVSYSAISRSMSGWFSHFNVNRFNSTSHCLHNGTQRLPLAQQLHCDTALSPQRPQRFLRIPISV